MNLSLSNYIYQKENKAFKLKYKIKNKNLKNVISIKIWLNEHGMTKAGWKQGT